MTAPDIDALAERVNKLLGDIVNLTEQSALIDAWEHEARVKIDYLVAIAKEAEHRLQSALDELGRKDAYAIEQYERAERAERERDELQDRALDDLASATRQEG